VNSTSSASGQSHSAGAGRAGQSSSIRLRPAVAVVVPARNAEKTLDRTICSIRTQTHSNLEIVVVDDASTDSTAGIVLAHARQDPRIRLVRNQVCRGVGAARNRGAAETSAGYVAFLDADDLMTVDSVAARLDAVIDSRAGIAYCWSAVIDADDRIFDTSFRPTYSGDLFQKLVGGNFIGNGSCVLCTREAIEAAGGFDEALFTAGAQGCEDYQFYLEVACRFPIVCVPRILIGYRETPDNMSSDTSRMLRSMGLVHANLLKARPELEPQLTARKNYLRLHFAVRAIRAGRIAHGFRLMAQLGAAFPRGVYVYLRKNFKMTRSEGLMSEGSKFPYCTISSPPTAIAAA